MFILKQSTAVDVLIGPFVDSTDGDTEETALTISQADVKLSKNGQTMAQKSDVTACAHDANGMYNCELDATDTNTVGTMVLFVHESGALAVRHEFQVVEEAVYVDLFAASAAGYAGITELATVDTVVDGIQTDLDNGTDGLGAIKATADAIETDTQDLQTQIGTAGAGLGDLGGMSTAMKAEVNTEVADVLNTDAHAEPTGVPAANESLGTKIGYLFMALRNRVDVTSTKKTFYDDGDAGEWEKDLTDNGTTYSESEGNAI